MKRRGSYRWNAADLEDMPTLSVGQADDLKAEGEDEDGPYRVWLSRCGVADGEPYPNKVTVERCRNGRWEEDETYRG